MNEDGISPEEWAKNLKAMDEASGINRNLEDSSEEQVYSLAGDNDEVDPDILNEESKKEKLSIEESLGKIFIPMENLPTKGRFYPKGSKIYVEALTVQEIRHWSTVDDSQPLEVNSYLNQILFSSTTFKTSDGKSIGYQQICDADRLFLLLFIRDLSMKEGEAKIEIPIRCRCGANQETKVLLSHSSIVLHEELEENLEKYYDEEERCFIIKTKSFGGLTMHLPRVGVMEKVYAKIAELEQQKKPWDKSFYVCLPFLIKNHALLDDEKSMNRLYNEFIQWSPKKFSIYDTMINKLKVGPTDQIKGICSKKGCGAEVTGDLTFPNGIKSLFAISNIDDELL